MQLLKKVRKRLLLSRYPFKSKYTKQGLKPFKSKAILLRYADRLKISCHCFPQIEYRYEEKSGRLRKCNYTVFQIEEESDYDRTQKEQMYYFACDNRPLLSLQKWYQDEDLHGKG